MLDWSTVKDVVNEVGSIATALALVAGAIQLRYILLQSRIEAQFSYVQAEREIWLAALRDREIAPNLLNAIWGKTPDVPASESLFLAILMDHFWHAYCRHKSGLVSKEAWSMFDQYFTEVLSTPPADVIWAHIKRIYPEDFVVYFDHLIRERGRAG